MKFSSILALAVAPLAIASPVLLERQNSQSVVSAVATIQQNIVTLNNTFNDLKVKDPQGLTKALKINDQVKTLGNAITAATNAAKQSPKFDATQSGDVAFAFLNLQPQIQSLLQNIVAKKPAIATAVFFVGDLSKTVNQQLTTQKQLTSTLGNTLIPKLASPYSDLAPSVLSQILGYFDTAIAAYASCSSQFCLPPISI